MGIAFKIASEQDTKKGNTGTMIFTTVVHRYGNFAQLKFVNSLGVLFCVVKCFHANIDFLGSLMNLVVY